MYVWVPTNCIKNQFYDNANIGVKFVEHGAPDSFFITEKVWKPSIPTELKNDKTDGENVIP